MAGADGEGGVIIVAVDPGLSGACSVLDHNGLRAVFDLPTMPDGAVGPKAKIQDKIDGRALVKLLRQHCPAGEPVKAVIEAVRLLGPKRGDQDGKSGNSVQSQGALFGAYRTCETVLECLGWAPAYASPQTWKRYFGLIDPDLKPSQRKKKSLECARRLYPTCGELGLAKFHNRAESLLIAHWYREKRA